jgi:outer membrane murein-binding lipoprotein Lpp
MNHKNWIGVALAALALLSGCKNGGHDQNSAQVRILNAVVDAEPLDLLVDTDVDATAVPVDVLSPYREIGSGTRTASARSSTNGAILATKSLPFNDGGDYTIVFFGKRASTQAIQLLDDTADPSSGHFKIRAGGLSPDVGLLDLYVLAGDLASNGPTMSSLSFGTVTDYLELVPGTYSFVLTTAGTKQVVFQSTPQTFAAGAKLTFLAMPSNGGMLANGELITSTSGTFMANPLARVKAINAIPDAGPLTFKADTATLLSNVPYTGISSYVTTPSGTHALSAELAAVPGTAIVSTSQALGAARDYTLIAGGMLSTAAPFLLTDDNSAPAAGFAKVRFANLRADGVAADVLVNFASRASGINPGSASDYFLLAASTATTGYTITFTNPGGVTVVATIDSGELDSGGIYTAFLFGTGASASIRLIRDR